MSRTTPRFLTALLAVALVATACGDDDGAGNGGTDAPAGDAISTTEYLAFRDQPVATVRVFGQTRAPAEGLRVSAE